MNGTGGNGFIWQVESFRFTLFHPITEKQLTDGLWEKITGELPSAKLERPQERLITEDGVWENCTLSVSTRPDRVDVIVSPGPISAPVLPSIGMIDKIRGKISHVLNKFSFHGITRIAFGMTLLNPEQDHISAYQSLAKLLPDVKIDPQSRDFLYQINTPVVSKTDPSVEINRLQVWAAVSLDFMGIDAQNRARLYASRLVLDVNTSDYVLSDPDNTRILMDELIDKAFEISQRGE